MPNHHAIFVFLSVVNLMYCATAFKEICLYLQDNLIFLDLLDKVDEDLFYNVSTVFFTSLPIYCSIIK